VESRCYREKEDEIRIGDFEPPEEDVPEYEIIEEPPVERDDAEAVRLLMDTLARSEEDYTLITRDIKSRYAERDAASIEFTDTTMLFQYYELPRAALPRLALRGYAKGALRQMVG
jgi:hypothetical protein